MKAIKLIIAAAIMATASLSVLAQVNSGASVTVTPVGSPTITVTDTSSGPSNPSCVFTATFQMQLKAIGGDFTVGLPGATVQLVTAGSKAQPGSVRIYKNGVRDDIANYNVNVAYSKPSSGVTTGAGSTFTIGLNSSVIVPVTVTFTPLYGSAGSVYAAAIGQLFVDGPSGISVMILSDEFKTPALSSPITTDATAKPILSPEVLKAMTSKTELGAYLARTARDVEINISSSAQVGYSTWKSAKLTGAASGQRISDALNAMTLSAKLSDPTADVTCSVIVHNADYSMSLVGYDTQKPVALGGDNYKLSFKTELRLDWDALILASNIRQVKLTTLDANGKVVDYTFLPVTEKGFYFPPRAAGSTLIEVTVNDGTPDGRVVVYDLRTGSELIAKMVSAQVEISIEGVEVMTDKDKIDLIPFTTNGVGENVRGDIRLSKATTVSIAAMTSEGGKAKGFKIRQVAPTMDADWTIKDAPNGVLSFTFAAGDWQVIPVWDPTVLKEPAYAIPQTGKG